MPKLQLQLERVLDRALDRAQVKKYVLKTLLVQKKSGVLRTFSHAELIFFS